MRISRLSRFSILALIFSFVPLSSIGQEAYAIYHNDVITFYYDNLREIRDQDGWQSYVLNEDGTWGYWGLPYNTKTVIFDNSFENARPNNTSYWFSPLENLEEIVDIQYLNTSNVTDMSGMFNQCQSLSELNLSSFDTSNVTDMSGMFNQCQSLLELNLSSFDTRKVTNMYEMFCGCVKLTDINLSGFNTCNVVDMSEMFMFCEKLNSLDLSNFTNNKVSNMNSMFSHCYNLTSINLSNFGTGSVTDMEDMFMNCHRLRLLDLSSFNTLNIHYIAGMFFECNDLKTIYVGNGWKRPNVDNGDDYGMFLGCGKLEGGMGTTQSKLLLWAGDPYADIYGAEYAHIDGGQGNPGYFTSKEAEPGTTNIAAAKGERKVDVDSEDGGVVIKGADGAVLSVYDAAGRLVAAQRELSGKETRVSLSSPGVYVLKMQFGKDETVIKKVRR